MKTEFRPRPNKDDLSSCHRAGWMYPDDIDDPLEQFNKRNGTERTLDRAKRELETGYIQAVYVLGAYIVYDVATDMDGNPMVLTKLDNVQSEPVVETYSADDRIL